MKRLVLLALCFLASLQASAQYLSPPQTGAVSYQGLWWNAPGGSENGWGLNISHQGNILFATWFTYDEAGKPMWFVIPNAQLMPSDPSMNDSYMDMMDMMMYGTGGMQSLPTYTGTIYRTSGPAFSSASFDSSKVTVTAVGSATLEFAGPSAGTFTYMLNGNQGSKPITRQAFSTMPACSMGGAMPATPNVSDLWWSSPAGSESGWGVNLTQQGDVLFATWFTYDAAGQPAWFVMSNGARAAGTQSWSGAIYHTSGPAFDARWDNTKVTVSPAGTASFDFSDASHGTFTYTVDGVTQAKPITRQVYSTPATICR
jgi:hypothetical protein